MPSLKFKLYFLLLLFFTCVQTKAHQCSDYLENKEATETYIWSLEDAVIELVYQYIYTPDFYQTLSQVTTAEEIETYFSNTSMERLESISAELLSLTQFKEFLEEDLKLEENQFIFKIVFLKALLAIKESKLYPTLDIKYYLSKNRDGDQYLKAANLTLWGTLIATAAVGVISPSSTPFVFTGGVATLGGLTLLSLRKFQQAGKEADKILPFVLSNGKSAP